MQIHWSAVPGLIAPVSHFLLASQLFKHCPTRKSKLRPEPVCRQNIGHICGFMYVDTRISQNHDTVKWTNDTI